jgi:Zn-dependent metalloprotease
MKRRMSFLLALIMLLTIIPFSSYAGNYDKQLKEAIIKSKELFNIGDEYDEFRKDISTRDDQVVFYLVWSDKKGKLGSIDVSMAEDGTVLSFSKWQPKYEEQKPQLPKISKEEGLEIAQDFIKKVSPKFANNIKYVEISDPLNIYSDSYNYHFVRTENEIPYYRNRVDIYIDNSTGEVKDYYANWDMDVVFPDTKDIISLEEAQKLYSEKIGLNLIYKTNYIDRKPNTYLIYGPLDTSAGINAKSGEVVPSYDYYGYYEKMTDMGAMGGAPEENLSPDEQKAIEDISGLISKEEAEKIARNVLELDSEYELRNTNLFSNWRNPNEYYWQMEFTREIDSKTYSTTYYTNISINAKTKELLSFYRDDPIDSEEKPKVVEEKALEIAKEYIKKVSPDKYDLIELDKGDNWIEPISEKDPQRIYRFQFNRKIDNAYVEGENIAIMVDGVNGKIREYRIDWTDKEFPSKENVIPMEKAYETLYKDIGMELKYTYTDRFETVNKKKKEATLLYSPKSDKLLNIDANTGILLDYNGKPYKEYTPISYNDIDKSYAKDKIKILAQYGIALQGEEFKPSEKITQRDFLYLLAKVSTPYMNIDSSEENLYNALINSGIIKENEKAPEKVVIKEEGIKYIIRALKYDKIADLTEIYKDVFKDTKDIDPKLKGYVAIAHGLKIVEGSNGKLNPKAELKREDAANMIYNYLFSGN